MPDGSLNDLAGFIRQLRDANIHHTLASVRDGAVMVCIAIPGQRWEVEFFDDRPTEVEIFHSDGEISGSELLERLFRE